MKQNLDESNCIQLFHNTTPKQWEFSLSLHRREFSLSHMHNPLNTNRIKVVHMFDSSVRQCSQESRRVIQPVVCACHLFLEYPMLLMSLQLFLVYYLTWSVYKKTQLTNKYHCLPHTVQLVLDEKAQPDSYIRCTAL